MRLNALKKEKKGQVNRFMNNLTDEQKHEVMVSLYSHTREGEIPEIYQYKENSTFGVLEGVVTIVEK